MRIETLLESAHVQSFAERIKRELGLKTFQLGSSRPGRITLMMIEVNREDRGSGVGTEAMRRLTDFADMHGLMIVLTPGLRDARHGTTSRGRLVNFYKRFGFIENKGRNKDFTISEGMYRLPR